MFCVTIQEVRSRRIVRIVSRLFRHEADAMAGVINAACRPLFVARVQPMSRAIRKASSKSR
jgi:hypothetical protein